MRNLGSEYNQDLQRESNRLRRSGIRDPEALQNQLSEYASRRLDETPTLSRALGGSRDDTRAAPSNDKELEGILKNVDLSQMRDRVANKLQEAVKGNNEILKSFGDYFDKDREWKRSIEDRIKHAGTLKTLHPSRPLVPLNSNLKSPI